MRGVIVKKLDVFSDERGWLSEIYRRDSDGFESMMSYISYTKKDVVRGPHEHEFQSDFFVFMGPGDFALHLWDNRKDSETFGEYKVMTVGESNKCSVLVPPGVVHGYKSLTGGFIINMPDKLYKGEDKKEEADEIRHELDENSKFKI